MPVRTSKEGRNPQTGDVSTSNKASKKKVIERHIGTVTDEKATSHRVLPILKYVIIGLAVFALGFIIGVNV